MMPVRKKKDEKQVWIRMPKPLIARVEQMARAEDRSFTSMMRILTEEAVQVREAVELRERGRKQ